MGISGNRAFGVFLGVLLVAAIWIVIALFDSPDLDSGQSRFLRYVLLIGLAGLLGFGAGRFFGGDKGFGVLVAAILSGSVVWIVVGLFAADLSPGQTTLVRYGVLLGLSAVVGLVSGAFVGEDKGVGVFLGGVVAGAAIWIVIALFQSVTLSSQGRTNFGYTLFIGIPLAVGFGVAAWKDSRQQEPAE